MREVSVPMMRMRDKVYCGELTEEDKNELRAAYHTRDAYVSEIMRVLGGGTDWAGNAYQREEVLALLRHEPWTEIPDPLLLECGAGSRLSTQHNNKKEEEAGDGPVLSGRHGATWNFEYDRKVRQRATPRPFRVPVEKPLPLSVDVQRLMPMHQQQQQQDHLQRYRVRRGSRSGEERQSYFSPLFSAANKLSAAEAEALLEFLRPAPNHTKEECERRMAARRAVVIASRANSKAKMNEPKKWPNLKGVFVSDNFVPHCATQRTTSNRSLVYGVSG